MLPTTKEYYMIHPSEATRLQFYIERDGPAGALAFARITYRTYRSALMQSRKRGFNKVHHATLPEYRRAFIESCITFRHYIYKGSLT
jgi:hypothetical protein